MDNFKLDEIVLIMSLLPTRSNTILLSKMLNKQFSVIKDIQKLMYLSERRIKEEAPEKLAKLIIEAKDKLGISLNYD